jgi:ABC-type phosphate transport system substrate-binding protein
MTRFKYFFVALLAAIVAVVPAANAQTVHVVAAGSSAQFLGTMIGMSFLADSLKGTGQSTYHWTHSNGLSAHDNRDSLNRILDETGNAGVVWIADSANSANNVTDVWVAAQYDSSLGVRLFSAQQKAPTAGKGATVYFAVAAGTAGGNLVQPNSLWADTGADQPLPASVVTVIGGSTPGVAHVNLALTDIRPEDALFATNRTKAALNATNLAGLGYKGATANLGSPVLSFLSTKKLTPIAFALTGGKDPLNTAATVPAYTTLPIGAAPVVFAINNGGGTATVTNLVSGVRGDGTSSGSFPLANLFNGTTACTTDNPAFGGTGPGAPANVTVYLREPLSGTMNTTEFSLFRSTGQTTNSQEKGVGDPAVGAPNNPLNKACASGGSRQRGIGTGDVLNAIHANVGGIGYFFFSFANAAQVNGAAATQGNYNYLTLDGVDPLEITGTINQELPFCSATLCTAGANWAGGVSFPTLRNGQYKAWSMYRWLVYTPDNDANGGPTALATFTRDKIDTTVADFVPFTTTTHSDGMEVYRSHYTQSAHPCTPTSTCNGAVTPTEALTDGNSLGGSTESGGDMGGLIMGWDYSTVTVTKATTTGAHAGHSHVTKTAGRTFGFSGKDGTHAAGQPLLLEGQTVTINGHSYVVSSAAGEVPTAASLYVTTAAPVGDQGTGKSFSAYIAPTAPGYVGHKQ